MNKKTMASNEWHESTLINERNPSIHLLTGKSDTFVNEDKKIRKIEIGNESGKHLSEKVIMFVGETGTGKTTMINTIANYFLGTNWEDNKRYKLIPDRDEKEHTSETSSKTKWITSYTFHQTKTLRYKVTLVDTPGFGDTGGKDRDNFITSQIREFFSIKGNLGGIDHIDAVAFVVKANSVRLTEAQLNIFKSVLALFGKDIGENIFLFITHAEATELDNQDAPVIQAAKDANLPVRGFCICNNNVLFYQKDNRESRLAQSNNAHYEIIWGAVTGNVKTFFDELDKCSSKSISLSAKVLDERRNLEITVEGLPDLITSSIVVMNTLRKEEEVLENFKIEVKSNQDFHYEVEEERITKIDLEGGKQAMVCTECERTCHFPCKRDIFIKIGGVRMCAAMRLFPDFRGCGVCLEHCAVSVHKLGSMKYEREIVRVTRTIEDMKKRYDIAKENMNNEKFLIDLIKQSQKSAQQDIEKCVSRLRGCLERLDEIALKTDPFSLLRSLDALQAEQVRKMEPGWEERIHELKIIYECEKERLSLHTAHKSEIFRLFGMVSDKWEALRKWRSGGKKDKESDNDDASCVN